MAIQCSAPVHVDPDPLLAALLGLLHAPLEHVFVAVRCTFMYAFEWVKREASIQ
jgi:hypothetical protein